MANKEISELTAGTAMDGTELVHGVQGGNSRKFTDLQLITPSLSAANQAAVRAASSAALKGHLFGLTLANNATDATNDIDIAAGEAASEQSSPILMVYAGAAGRQLDVAYGTGSGARFDTSISDGTWHAFIISNGTTVGFGFSKSLDPTGQANYPSGHTHYRRIGSIIRESSSVVGFVQDGDSFTRKVPAGTGLINNPGTAAVLQAIKVPTGLRVVARIGVIASGANASNDSPQSVLVSDPSSTNTAPSTSAFNFYVFGASTVQATHGGELQVTTDTSAQVRYRIENSTPGTNLYFSALGWRDNRGRI